MTNPLDVTQDEIPTLDAIRAHFEETAAVREASAAFWQREGKSDTAKWIDEQARIYRAAISLIEALPALLEDSARIDWLEQNSAHVEVFDPPNGDAWVWSVAATDDNGEPLGFVGCNSALREAIDAARGPSNG